MTVKILHMRYDLQPEERWRLTVPTPDEETRAARALDLYQKGGYEAVAEVATDDLEEAYKLTQNGVVSDSWSRMPPEGLVPLGQAYVEKGGQKYGRKSSEVGDIFIRDGEAFVVASFGFEPIKGWEPEQALTP